MTLQGTFPPQEFGLMASRYTGTGFYRLRLKAEWLSVQGGTGLRTAFYKSPHWAMPASALAILNVLAAYVYMSLMGI